MVSFRQHSGRTTTAEGSNPTWNEQITLPVPSDMTAEATAAPHLNHHSSDSLCLSIFDEVVEDHHQDDDHVRSTSEIYQRIFSRWLGEIRIPFRTILSAQNVCGIMI